MQRYQLLLILASWALALCSWRPRMVSLECYASRILSDVERRYAQTEKEALALVWASEQFHMYVYGIEFEDGLSSP